MNRPKARADHMPQAPSSRRTLYVAEPAGAWTQHPPAVVDCSVVAALLWSEAAAAEALARISERNLNAPSLLPYELANVARSKCRAGVPPDVALQGLAAFDDRRITLHEIEPALMFDVAARHELSAYDAAYLALAIALKAPLITFDRRLAEAARRHQQP